METVTRKGPGRPRKVMAIPPNAGQDKEQAHDHAGNGHAGETGATAPAVNSVPTWNELKKAVQSYKSWKNSVAMAFFPNPPEEAIETQCGWVRVVSGAPRIQMNSGQEIFL